MTGYIDITKPPYNCVGDGSRDSYGGFAQAIADAEVTGKVLYVPPGTFLITFTSQNPGIPITNSLTIIGADKQLSILKFGPADPTFDYNALDVQPGHKLHVQKVTIQGPASSVGTGRTCGLYLHSSTANSQVDLQEVDLTGKFVLGIYVESGAANTTGTVVFNATDCDCTCYGEVVSFYADPEAIKYLNLTRCTLHGGGAGGGHLIYVHPHCAISIDKCRFYDNPNWAIQHYGTNPTQAVPPYARITDCVFEQTQGRSIVTSDRISRTIICGCTFNNQTGIQVRASCDIIGCTFATSRSASISLFSSYANSNLAVNITGCTFDFSFASPASGIDVGGDSQALWNITGCTFIAGTSANPICIQATGQTDAPNVRISDCAFLANSTAGGFLVISSKGNWIIQDCYVKGRTTHDGGAIIIRSQAPLSVTLVNNTFDVTPRGGYINVAAGANGVITGSGNNFLGTGSWFLNGTTQNLILRQAVGPQIAAADEITLSTNADTYRITGTTRINRITIFGGNDLWAGSIIKLVADAGWSLGNGGNIIPKSAGSPKPVNTVTQLMYDRTAGKWIEL